jgi:cell division protein FtsL
MEKLSTNHFETSEHIAVSSTLPITLVILYTVAVVCLAVIVVLSSHHMQTSQQSIDELNTEIEKLRKTIHDHPEQVNGDKVLHFIEQLKQQGIDVKNLENGR